MSGIRGTARVSLRTQVTQLANKLRWSAHDIVDYGVSSTQVARPRFSLRPATLQTVERIFRLLQVLLATLAFEVPQRKAVDNYHYLLDPMGDLFPTLRGASSLEELFGAWDILRERLAKGDRFVSKYLEESQGAANVTSPASTASDVYKPFEPAVSTAYRIREYCAKVPSHMTETDPSILDHLLDPNFALDELVDVPLQIKSVFPPRQPEENPLVFSYNEKGAKEDLSHLSRTSLSPGFVMGEDESISMAIGHARTRSQGKAKAVSFQNSDANREKPKAAGTNWSTLYRNAPSVEPQSSANAPERTPSAVSFAPDVRAGNFLHGMVSSSVAPGAPTNSAVSTITRHIAPPSNDARSPPLWYHRSSSATRSTTSSPSGTVKVLPR